MLPSILTFLCRNFLRNLSYSVIALSSLIVGITTAILLFVWISYELGFNQSMPDAERTYAILFTDTVEGEIVTDEGTYTPIFDFLQNEIPEVESVTRIDNSSRILANGEKSIEQHGAYADAAFFKVFPPTLVAGTLTMPKDDNRSIVISMDLAHALFGQNSPLGKTIEINRKTEFKVIGVYEPFPKNSDFDYINFVLPYLAKPREADEWTNYYLKLYDPSTREAVEQKIDKKIAQLYEGDESAKAFLFALADWHLHWNFENGKVSGGRIVYLIIFGISGLLVLVMACVNYMNIATARATKRSREVGVRKMTGATQRVLVRQFMTESLIITFAAAAISLFVAYTLLPFFNLLIGINLTISFTDPLLLSGLITISVFTGLLAGSYPSLLLASFKPAVVLKGSLYSTIGGAGIRNALVVFQFTLSVIIVFCSLVMWQQTNFLLNKDLGYDKHKVINVWLNENVNYSFTSLRADALGHTSVEAVAFGGTSPMEVNGYSECNRVQSPFSTPLLFYGANIDENILPTLKFEILQGRNFSQDFPFDSANFIITERAAELLGFDNPVGEKITYTMFGKQEGEIIGVIKDFQNDDIHTAIKPVVFVLEKKKYLRNMFVRYEEGKLSEAVDHIKNLFEKIHPGIPVYYSFLDTDFETQLYREKLLGNISIWFMVISVTIACLGLFGLVLFNTQRRTKEIGIRKVLGASAKQVATMLCRDFVSPVVYSIVIAFPIGFWLMQKFLESYASRVSISLGTFVLVGSAIAVLVLITVSYQSLKAALRNPVEALKTE
jgi:putative ABC transport system permease protein